MINIFDRTLKIIARNHALTFLRLAFPGQDIRLLGVVENVEISLSVKPVDFVHRVALGDEECILHLEFQLEHQADLPQRTFITSAELTDLFKEPVLSLVLYLKPRQTPIPNEYRSRIGEMTVNRFSYPVLKLWDYMTSIRQGELRELAPMLLMLVNDPDVELLAEERALILQEPNTQKRADLLAAAVAIGSRYFDSNFLWKFFSEEVEQMKKVSFIEDWIEQGVEEGIEKGLEQGRHEMAVANIAQILLTRFDPPSKQLKRIEQRLQSLDSVPVLQKLLQDALLTESFEAFTVIVEHYLTDQD